MGIEEIKRLLHNGITLDELWRVGRGEVDFRVFREQNHLDVEAPQDVVVETPPPPPEPVQEEKHVEVEKEQRKETKPKEASPDVKLGTSTKPKDVDIISLIKPAMEEVPLLSAEKAKTKEKPMDYIVQNAAVDPTTKWRRLYNLGSHTELFVSVKQEEEQGEFIVDITTDAAFPFILHWGIAKTNQQREWQPPPEELFPPLTTMSEDRKAADTAFAECTEEECDLELVESRVPLQRAKIRIPWDAGVSNVLFVLRSADRSRWYKDGHGNFVVPLPGTIPER